VPGDTIDPVRFARMIAAFRSNGGVIDQSPDVQSYLRMRNADGITFDAKTILLPVHPTPTAVFEEFIHTAEHRTGVSEDHREIEDLAR